MNSLFSKLTIIHSSIRLWLIKLARKGVKCNKWVTISPKATIEVGHNGVLSIGSGAHVRDRAVLLANVNFRITA